MGAVVVRMEVNECRHRLEKVIGARLLRASHNPNNSNQCV